jgi:penicillin-binding protein 2
MAAPMVRNFFEPLKDEIKEIIAPPMKALVVIPEDGEASPDGAEPEVLKAIPIDEFELEGDDTGEVLRAIPIDEDVDVSEGFDIE